MINISPRNKLKASKILVYTVAPSELWVYSINNFSITSTVSNTKLRREEDNQGLYYRVRHHISSNMIRQLYNFGVNDILFACAPYQEEAPLLSNKLIIYDMFNQDRIIDPHLCRRICANDMNLMNPEMRIIANHKLKDLYVEQDDFMFWGGSQTPRPLLAREFESTDLSYRLIDPYLQWSPSRFSYNEDRMEDIPGDLEQWMSYIVDSFNWDYFYDLFKSADIPLARLDNLTASIFDILYDDYLYYGICKKIWVDKPEGPQEYKQLSCRHENQIIINFTDIVNSIKSTISSRLLRDQMIPLESDDMKGPLVDHAVLEAKFDQLFDKLEIVDENRDSEGPVSSMLHEF